MRTLTGTIVSNRMARTVVVRVERLIRHRTYGKYHRRSRRFKAHAEDAAACRIGDVVEIQETRPLSREKRWRVLRVVRPAPAPAAAEVSGETEVPEEKL